MPCSREDIQAALDEAWKRKREDPEIMCISDIAELYSVPNSTLARLLSKNLYKAPKIGRNPLLPFEFQALLSERIASDAEQGLPWSDSRIRATAILIWQTLEAKSNPEKDVPQFSRTWMRKFKKTWKLSTKVAVSVSSQRKTALHRCSIMAFLKDLQNFVREHELEAKHIFTSDETTSIPKKYGGKHLVSAVGKAIFLCGSVLKVPKFSMFCIISAARIYLPATWIVPVSNKKKREESLPVIGPKGFLDECYIEVSASGRMTKKLFHKVLLENFAVDARKEVNDDKWILLIVDNCTSHVDIKTIQALHKKKIALAFLPPNTTEIASPLDVAVYGPLKTYLKKNLENFQTLKFANLAAWVETPYRKAFSPTNIQSGFSATGIWNYKDNEPNCDVTFTQYKKEIIDIPEDMKKLNLEERHKKALRIVNQSVDTIIRKEKEAATKENGACGGPRFVQRALAGKVTTMANLRKVQTSQADIKRIRAKAILAAKEAKELEKGKLCLLRQQTKQKMLSERALWRGKLANKTHIAQEYKKKQQRSAKSVKTWKTKVKQLEFVVSLMIDQLVTSPESASMLIEKLRAKNYPITILMRKKKFRLLANQRNDMRD